MNACGRREGNISCDSSRSPSGTYIKSSPDEKLYGVLNLRTIWYAAKTMRSFNSVNPTSTWSGYSNPFALFRPPFSRASLTRLEETSVYETLTRRMNRGASCFPQPLRSQKNHLSTSQELDMDVSIGMSSVHSSGMKCFS